MCEHKGLMVVVVLCVIAACSFRAKAAIVIDDFSAPDGIVVGWLINHPSLDPWIIKISDASIFGGERDLLIDVQGGPLPMSSAGSVGMGSLLSASLGAVFSGGPWFPAPGL